MKVLVACEESQAVCKAFRESGHEAYSCDIETCSGGHPEWHIQQDVLPLLNGRCSFKTMDGIEHSIDEKWDLIIAHPPCTYLSNAGARWLYAGGELNAERYKKGLDGKKFFMAMLNADCTRVAVENPIPSSIYDLPKYNQVIQPYQFGEPWSKKTCLWLKGLEPLKPTQNLPKEQRTQGIWKANFGGKQYAWNSSEVAKLRSRTPVGVAKAMAEQWGYTAYKETINETD